MKKEITVDGVVYEEKEVQAETPKEYKRWRADYDERYYYVDSFGDKSESDNDFRDDEDNYRYNTGNYFKNEAECERKREYDLSLQKLKDSTEGFVPDFIDDYQDRWDVYYDYDEKVFEVGLNEGLKHINNIFFPTDKLLEKSLKENKKDWEIVRDYKG